MVPIQTKIGFTSVLLTNNINASDIQHSHLVSNQEEYIFKVDEKEIQGVTATDLRVSLSRVLLLHNRGSVPVTFNKPRFDDQECRSLLRIWVDDCKSITLIDTHKIEVHIDENLRDIMKMPTIILNLYS